jgi:heme-NO-binding protein
MHGIVHAELQKFVIARHGRPVWQELLSVVRLRNQGAAPPQLRFRRVGPAEVHLSYNSNRKMCAVARGIIRGVAKHFEESVTIVESACMHQGAPSCELSIRLAARSQGRGLS